MCSMVAPGPAFHASQAAIRTCGSLPVSPPVCRCGQVSGWPHLPGSSHAAPPAGMLGGAASCPPGRPGPGHRGAQPGGGSPAVRHLVRNDMARSLLSEEGSETAKGALAEMASPCVQPFPGPACAVSQRQKPCLLKPRH